MTAGESSDSGALPGGVGASKENRTGQTAGSGKPPAQPEQKPSRRPPSRRNPILSAVSGVLSFLLIAALAGGALFLVTSQRMASPGPLLADKVVVIPPHTDVPEVVDELVAQGVIDDGLLFNAALIFQRKRSKVEAGEYLFKSQQSMQSVLDAIVSGKQLLHAITIPEGLTSQQIVQRLAADDALAGNVAAPPEGTLFPETYKFVRGTSRASILREMQRDGDRVLQEVWSARAPDSSLKSPFELLTLASIVEKETGLATERPLVAAVFLNRLQRGMRLQSDPTVVYGLVGGKGTLGAGITRTQLEQATPYNTYLIDGLPPGPISNPGRAALEATAHPAKSDALYFVADGSGGHVFAATLAQHNRNVQHWREIEKAKSSTEQPVDQAAPDLLPGGDGAATGPGAAPSPRATRTDRHSDLGNVSIFGVLPSRISPSAPTKRAPVGAFAALKTMSPALADFDADPQTSSSTVNPAAKKPGLVVSLGPSLDSLGLTIDDPAETARAVMDGPAEDPTPGSIDPDYSANAGSGQTTSRPALPPIDGRPRIIDASVGTPLDPLKNTTWDLNSPKTVPALN